MDRDYAEQPGVIPGSDLSADSGRQMGCFLNVSFSLSITAFHCSSLLVRVCRLTRRGTNEFFSTVSLSLSLSARHCLSLLVIPRLHRWSELAGWQMNCSMFMYNCNHYFILCHFPLSLSTIPYTASKNLKGCFFGCVRSSSLYNGLLYVTKATFRFWCKAVNII